MNSFAGVRFSGTDQAAGLVQFNRAREAGICISRALLLGDMASRGDCWEFRSNLGERRGLSTKTVQRAINDGREAGLLQVFRSKKREVPPGRKKHLWCGWSHRLMVGRDKVGAALAALIAQAKASWLVRQARTAARALERRALQRRDSKVEQERERRRLAAEQFRRDLEREQEAERAAREQPD